MGCDVVRWGHPDPLNSVTEVSLQHARPSQMSFATSSDSNRLCSCRLQVRVLLLMKAGERYSSSAHTRSPAGGEAAVAA